MQASSELRNPTSRYQPAPNVTYRVLSDDEMMLLDLDTGRYFGLNRMGAQFFELLASNHSIAETSRKVASDYGVPELTVNSDLGELVDLLLKNQLIQLKQR